MEFDRNKSLQELENSDWGEPQSDSPLERAVLQLRKVPLILLEERDLLRLLTQHVGIEYLIPLALEKLRIDPLADREFYPGCFLGSLLRAPSTYWDEHPALRSEVEQLYLTILLNEAREEDLTQGWAKNLYPDWLIFTEFGPFISLLWNNIKVRSSFCNHRTVEILAVIASRQPITLSDLSRIRADFTPTSNNIEFLLENKFVIYNYEGPFPAERYFRLSKEFRKELGLSKK